ncbi:MAG: nucleotidyltransferase family protein [Bacteroidales bacterium]|nr:nucleotidyltransferase family protein [Bacteroidales bacterium]
MKAMIFAAGLGTRLKPFTLHHPKAMAEVGGVPMLERVMRKFIDFGVDELVVNVHHFSQQIIDFIHAHEPWGVPIHISDESSELLDTGGGILAARQWLDGDEPFFVHNADILTNFPLDEMWRAHLATRPLSTLLVAHRSTSRYLLMDSEMRMRGWTNQKTGQVLPPDLSLSGLEPWAFGGVHILSPRVFTKLKEYAADRRVFPIMPFYIDECQVETIQGYCPTAAYRWHDIGNPDSLERAQLDFGR